MPIWNPNQYLKFKNERTQPSLDLIARVQLEQPRRILDLGCGPGNSTAALRARWPEAHVTGLDNSPEMINAAKTDFPGGEWLLGDIASLQPREPYDLYFANAALQWLPNHETLLPRLLGLVRPGGALAVQVPDMGDSPLAKSVVWVAHQPYWRELTAESERTVNYRSAEYYFPILNSLKARFELWQTTYYHVLPSQTALLDWYRGTGLKPFLDRLPDETFRTKFLGEIFQQIAPYYPGETDGRVVLPFKRVFFTIYR